MAVNFSSGFRITSNEAVDERIIKTKEEMRNMTPADLARMPDKYFCMCADDGQIYFYDKDGGFKPETGYFTAFDSTVADDIKNSEEVQGALTNNIINNIDDNKGVQGALTTNITNNIVNDTGVQSALGSAISGNTDIQDAIGGVISTNEEAQKSIASVVENSEAVQQSIASAISTSSDIQAQIDQSVQDALDSGTVEVKTATNIAKGIVVGDATGKNKISVDEDGEMEINSVGVEKLSNTEGVRLILNGGKAPVIS